MENVTMPAVLIDVNMFWQIINFCILMWIFKKKFFGPISKIISERRDLIAKALDDAKTDKETAERLKQEAQDYIKKSKAEATQLLVDAERKSEERTENILKEAHSQREKMIKSGEAEVEKLKDVAKKDLERYTRDIAADLTEKLVASKTASTLIDEAINKVGEE